MKVSVTVPVYNTSNYLKQCFDSLASQSLEDIEFIIVNDGSTDTSGKICDEYSALDNRFKVIHQENGGLASARQTGLKASHGEYIIVCDSDDWVDADMYKELYECAKKHDADIVTCGFFIEYGSGKRSRSNLYFKERDGLVINKDLISRGAGATWVKLVKRSLFIKANINYEIGINLSEDSLIVYKLMQLNPKVIQLRKPLYHYRRIFGSSSYTNNLSMKSVRQLFFTYNWLKDNYSGKEWRNVVVQRGIDFAFACLRVPDVDEYFLSQFLESELSWKKFNYKFLKPKGLIVLMCKLFSVSFGKKLTKYLYRFVYS